MNERKLQELWTCAMAGLAFAVVFILIAAALSTALAQGAWLWGGPPTIYPGCPNNYSPDGTTPDADPKVVYACWKTLNNWMPIPSCVQPYNGTVVSSYIAICHKGGCVPYPGGDADIPRVIEACLTR